MKYDIPLTTNGWGDYELLDSGDLLKLERFGALTLIRPETQALWPKHAPDLWKKADATFSFKDKHGIWKAKKEIPDSWNGAWNDVTYKLARTNFKHVGIFPEQAANWEWMTRAAFGGARVLNLFGYTGIATVALATTGAIVTHVDASKQSLDWANENAQLSHIPSDHIRWMYDDALAFVKREVRRGSTYDGIVLDPPAFGRGAKGEVWHIEEDLPKLLSLLTSLLSKNAGSFFLLNGYAAGFSSRTFGQLVDTFFSPHLGESGELLLAEKNSTRVIPSGIYARFIR